MITQFLNLQEGSIAYDDSGSGPLVVCVPGMGDLRAEFRFLTPQLLAAGYRVVTMDVRGHGETSVVWGDYSVAAIGADILALIRHLDSGPAVIVGSSMASGAAVWAAAEAPDLVRGLVLLGPAVHGQPSLLFRLVLPVLFARPWGPAAWRMYFKKLFPTRPPADLEAYAERLQQNLSLPGRMKALQKMMLAPQTASAQRLSRVNAPAQIVMGSKDPDFKDPSAEAEWVAGQLRGACKVVEGAGHYPHSEMPEIAGPVVVSFLDRIHSGADHAAPARR